MKKRKNSIFLVFLGHYLALFISANASTISDGTTKELKEADLPKQDEFMALKEQAISEVEVYNALALQGDKNKKERTQIVGSSRFGFNKISTPHVYFLFGAEHLKLSNYYFDIPVIYNKEVKRWIHYFSNQGKELFIRYSERSGRYAPILAKILEDYGLPRDLIFLAMAESGFHNKAKSWARAVGPWQFMPYTGKKFGLKINWYVDERRDPIKATIAAARYLKILYEEFGSWELAAAAYNAGEGKIGRAIKKYATYNFWDLREGRYLKDETKNYVPKIMALAIIGKNLNSFSMGDISFSRPLDFDEIDVPGSTDLVKLSEELSLSFEEIQILNPELLRWVTPPDELFYKLRVPVGTKAVWLNCCAQKDFTATSYQIHKVDKSSSISTIAEKFNVAPKILAQINNFSTGKWIAKGSSLQLPFRVGQNKGDPMYTDLFELPSKKRKNRIERKKNVENEDEREISKRPSEFYIVKKGDTLWDVSKKTGVLLDTIILSNLDLLNKRMIQEGDKLVIR